MMFIVNVTVKSLFHNNNELILHVFV